MFEIAVEIFSNTIVPSIVILVGLFLSDHIKIEGGDSKLKSLTVILVSFYTYSQITGAFIWPVAETVHVIPYLFVLIGVISLFHNLNIKFEIALWLIPLNIGAYFALNPLFEDRFLALLIQLALLNLAYATFHLLEEKLKQNIKFPVLFLTMFAAGVGTLVSGSTLLAMILILNGGIVTSFFVYKIYGQIRESKNENLTVVGRVGVMSFLLLLADVYNYVL